MEDNKLTNAVNTDTTDSQQGEIAPNETKPDETQTNETKPNVIKFELDVDELKDNTQKALSGAKNKLGEAWSNAEKTDAKLLQNILYGACGVMAVSVFLPFISINFFGFGQSTSLISISPVFGLIYIVLAGATAGITYLKKAPIAAIVTSGITFLLWMTNRFGSMGELKELGELVKFQIGSHLLFLSSVAMIVISAMIFTKSKKTN